MNVRSLSPIMIAACLLFTFNAYSAFSPDSLLHKTFAQRWPYFQYISKYCLYGDTTEIKRYIDSVHELAVKNKDRDLELNARFLHVYYLTVRQSQNHTLCLAALDTLRQELIEQKDTVLLARVENIEGNYAWIGLNNYEMAFECLVREYDLIHPLSDTVYPDKQTSLYALGECYYFFNDYSRAFFYLKEMLNVEGPACLNYWKLQANNTIGLCYQQMGQLDSADYYFKSAYQLATENSNEGWQGIANGNLGYDLFLRGRYDEAIPLLQNDVELSVKRVDWACASGSQMVLADISLRRNNITQAASLLNDAYKWVTRSGQYTRLHTLYPLLSKLYSAQGKPQLAALYLDSTIIVKDSLARKYSGLQILRVQQKEDLQQHRTELAQIEGQKRIKTMQRNALLAVLVILLLLALYLYALQRNRHMQKQQLLDMQLKEKQQQLEISKIQLSEFARSISEKSGIVSV